MYKYNVISDKVILSQNFHPFVPIEAKFIFPRHVLRLQEYFDNKFHPPLLHEWDGDRKILITNFTRPFYMSVGWGQEYFDTNFTRPFYMSVGWGQEYFDNKFHPPLLHECGMGTGKFNLRIRLFVVFSNLWLTRLLQLYPPKYLKALLPWGRDTAEGSQK